MAYKCSDAAFKTMARIVKAIREVQNVENIRTFKDRKGRLLTVDVGRENKDGAITGSVYHDGERIGTYKIEGDGTFTRWNFLPKEVLVKAGIDA